MTLRDAAIAWARRGFRVFPLIPNQKKPLWEGWQDIATTDVEKITEWWTDKAIGDDVSSQWNVGYITDDLCVYDIDVKHGPQVLEFYQDELYGQIGETLTVQTPSGGLHCIYLSQGSKSSASQVFQGLDIRGVGSLAVAPHSIINGVEYKILHDVPTIWVPPHLREAAGYAGPRVEGSKVAVIELDNPIAWYQGELLAKAAHAPQEGGRDDACFRLACELKDVGLSEASTASVIALHWADRCSPSFPGDEVSHAVASAYSSGQNAPGSKNALYVAGFGTEFAPVAIEGMRLLPGGGIPNEVSLRQAQGFDGTGLSFGNVKSQATLQPRDWIMQRMLIRKEITAIVAPGGVGKSQFGIYLGICLAAGIDMLNFKNMTPGVPQKTVIYNAEDSEDELALRFYAQCFQLELDPNVIAPHIMFISGKNKQHKFRISDPTTDKHDPEMNYATTRVIKELIGEFPLALFIADPLVKIHSSPENDNNAMTRVMELFEEFIGDLGCAGLLMHHTSKPQGTGGAGLAGNIDMLRGASGIKDATRACFTLSPPLAEDVTKYGLSDTQARHHLRLDDAKMNRGIMGDPVWLEKFERQVQTSDGSYEAVGAFGEGDIHALGADAAMRMADMVDAALDGKHSSSMTITEAIAEIRRTDLLAAQLDDKKLKLRVESVFSERRVASTGLAFQLIKSGNTRNIQVVS